MYRVKVTNISFKDIRVISELAPKSLGEKYLTPQELRNCVNIVATDDNNKTVGFLVCESFKGEELKYKFKHLHKDNNIFYLTTCYVKPDVDKEKVISLLVNAALTQLGDGYKILVPVWNESDDPDIYKRVLTKLKFKPIKCIVGYWSTINTECDICEKGCHCSCTFYLKEKLSLNLNVQN